ncbi:MAG: SPOR domain-containing protein [Bryobacteraceae bacterium]|nr:SPOR domain-containing protein [Bryobacteraceae bacterium]
MERNEAGEYELVLGNRQLLSIFFLVVVLLGVGFALGFLLGRNSAVAAAPVTAAEPVKKSEPSALKIDPPETVKPEAAPASAGTKKAEPSPEPEKPSSNETSGASFKSGVPPAGSLFVQVAAGNKADAEMEAKSLNKRGYATWVAPDEKGEKWRVLVGPLENNAEFAKTRAALQELGFKGPIRREYK